MAVAERVKSDLQSAMKAGERERVGALRLVLSELQKAAKDGDGDELAVLRRERKRRLEAARAFRAGGRPELADTEEDEAELIAAYLPADLDEEALARIVADVVSSTGAAGPGDLGRVMGPVMAQVAGRTDGQRVSARVREALAALSPQPDGSTNH
jgi:uncharacterized protein YqeY